LKKLIILLLISTYSVSSFGQDSINTINEFYLTIANFSPVNVHLKYKRQIGNKTFFKVGLVNLSASSNNQQYKNSSNFWTSTLSYSAGIELGIEFRKQLTKRFSLFHGPNLSCTYREKILRVVNPSLSISKQKDIIQSYSGAHLYSNHFEQAKLQLSRACRPLPTLVINPAVKNIVDFKYEDFSLEGYDPHPHIKAIVAM
jgi:hypothetical protein